MDYYELNFNTGTTETWQRDLLIGALGEIGFDTFEETAGGFKAYISTADFDEEKIKELLTGYEGVAYDKNFIPQQNWNQLWESNFEPITISNKIYVRATFHPPVAGFPYEIVIDPKMAFGTGHHQTTSMMMEFLLKENLKDKHVLDMGCGTGILAILAAKLGAGNIVAIDNDSVCYDSTIENAALNGVENIRAICGSKEIIPNEKFDLVLANINRNILVDQMPDYAGVLAIGGTLLMSGFYDGADLEIIKKCAQKHGLSYVEHTTTDNWAAVKVVL